MIEVYFEHKKKNKKKGAITDVVKGVGRSQNHGIPPLLLHSFFIYLLEKKKRRGGDSLVSSEQTRRITPVLQLQLLGDRLGALLIFPPGKMKGNEIGHLDSSET